MQPPDSAACARLWAQCCVGRGTAPESLGAVESFGDGPEMADRLVDLVLSGVKRATAGLLRDQGASPTVGEHWIAVDGRGLPRCVLRTTDVRVGLLDTVDDAFARDEGEGERTRAWWLQAHRTFFARQHQPFDEAGDLVVFERMAVVWPVEDPS